MTYVSDLCRGGALLLVASLLALPAAAVSFTPIALTGDVAPGTGGATYASFNRPSLNSGGTAAFIANLSGAGVTTANATGLFTGTSLIARGGGAAPGTGGAIFRSIFPASLNDGGEAAFIGDLSGAGVTGVNGRGIFTGTSLIARGGDVAPGTGGATYLGFSGAPSLNAGGAAAFRASLTGTGVSTANDGGIFTGTSLIAREGGAAPGTGGASYTGFGAPSLNDNGEAAFTGTLTGTGVIGLNNQGVFTGTSLIARGGDVAPGTGGAIYSFFSGPLSLNDNGEVAFVGSLAGAGVTSGNNSGLFIGTSLIAREGDVAAGTGGAIFSASGSPFGSPSLNNRGEVAFIAILAGAGVTGANDFGIFLWDGIGMPELLVREGDTIDLGGGDMRTVSSLNLSLEGLNDGGDVAFRAAFTDGSQGIILAEADAAGEVPLPASAWLLLGALAGFGALRRRADRQTRRFGSVGRAT